MRCFIPLLWVMISCSTDPPGITTKRLESNTTSLLQAISIQDERIAWISGHAATVCRTTDAGESWEAYRHPEADTLQFRDLHALNRDTVVLMSAGPGAASRIYLFSPPAAWQ